jgi:hypothetical protein
VGVAGWARGIRFFFCRWWAVQDCRVGSILETVDDGSRRECGGMVVVAGMTVLRVTMRLRGWRLF